jgi:hypothetical protein
MKMISDSENLSENCHGVEKGFFKYRSGHTNVFLKAARVDSFLSFRFQRFSATHSYGY